MENHLKKMPSPLLSLVPILVLVALLFVTIRTFGSDALSGGSQVVLLTTTAVASLLAMIFCKVKWRDIEEAICKNILGVATAIIILLLIGALSGSWMISGIVPTLIYYGMQIIHPCFFLASCCVICAVVSVMTGSSWTTIATIGIALMGIGEAQGFATGWVAGAIISGAYFGDKISPLSDTTVLASSVTHTPLFSHIRYMMLTTIPSMVITLIIFTIAGFTHTSNASGQIAEFAASLNESFNISLWLLIVPVVTGILIAKKVPSLITLFISTAMAGVFAIFFQPHLLQEVAGVTSPNMIRGMENDRKLPNNELKVTKIRAIPPGKNWPNNTPAAIAITTLVNNDTLIFFMVLLYFEANGGHRNTHQRTDQVKEAIRKIRQSRYA